MKTKMNDKSFSMEKINEDEEMSKLKKLCKSYDMTSNKKETEETRENRGKEMSPLRDRFSSKSPENHLDSSSTSKGQDLDNSMGETPEKSSRATLRSRSKSVSKSPSRSRSTSRSTIRSSESSPNSRSTSKKSNYSCLY